MCSTFYPHMLLWQLWSLMKEPPLAMIDWCTRVRWIEVWIIHHCDPRPDPSLHCDTCAQMLFIQVHIWICQNSNSDFVDLWPFWEEVVVWSWKITKFNVLSVRKGLPYPSLCQKRCVSCFCFPRKNVFLWKIFFCILNYSTAMSESSTVIKIINFHKKTWFSLIFIDFHWFWSKNMKIDGFQCSWTSPASGIRSGIVFVAFLNRWEKTFFSWKILFCNFALPVLYSYAQSRARSSKSSIFTKNHCFSLILIKNH